MIRKELLDIICCPKCKGDLSFDSEKDLLRCVKCGKTYAVKNDIPILLPDHNGQ